MPTPGKFQSAQPKSFTRRDFLKAGGAALTSVFFLNALASCSTTIVTETKTATATKTATKTVTFTETVPAANTTRTLIDHLDRTVEVMTKPQRIISLHMISTEIIYMLNAQDKMLAFDSTSAAGAWTPRLDPDCTNREVLSIGDTPPNVEAIAVLKPDIVIGAASWPEQIGQVANIAKIVAFDFHGKTTIEAIDLIGKAIGKEAEAQELILYLNGKTEAITAITDTLTREQRPKTVYGSVQSASSEGMTLRTCGNQAFQHGLIEKAGGINLGEDFPVTWQALTTEELLNWTPDVMFMSPSSSPGKKSVTLEDMENDPALHELTLVKNGRFYLAPYGAYPCVNNAPESIIGLEFLAKNLHPDRFGALDLKAEVKELYSRWYRYQLNDEELETILNPK
jgi:iron complex transport system substrate-binding protein